MITGRSALSSSASARSSAAPSASADARRRHLGDLLGVGLHEDHVEREVEEHRAGVRPAGDRERLVDEARDLRRRARGRGELDDRAHERHVVDLLQRALPQRNAGARPPRTTIGEWFCSADAIAAHPVGHARARRSARRPPARA